MLFAPLSFRTFLANSISATCIPKHIPKYGIWFSLAYLQAKIIPSIPLSPKPPGTKIASVFDRTFLTFLPVIVSAKTKLIFTFVLCLMPACSNASLIDLYESCSSVYFPTKATLTSFSGLRLALTTLFQSESFGFFDFILSLFNIIWSTFCLFSNKGIE